MKTTIGLLVDQKMFGMPVRWLVATALFVALSFGSRAVAQPQVGLGATDTPSASKSQYTLFNMTPRELRRPFVTDRGLASPYTIDAGAYALGASASYGYRDRMSMGYDHTTEWWNFGAVVKAGIFNNFDLEARVPDYETSRTTYKSMYGSDSASVHGFGDFSLTGKYNFIGNDGGNVAWAASATVRFPTACYQIEPNDYYAGGLSSQFAYLFPCGFQLRMVNGFLVFDRTFDSYYGEEDCWEACFCDDICLFSPMLMSNLQAYAGFDTDVSTSSRVNWNGSLKAGFTYNLTANAQLFAQSEFGVNGSVGDYVPSIGFDFRY